MLNAYEVPFRVMHGFASATTVNEIAHASLASAQPLVALYAGDWDPSGLHMSNEDLPKRLHTYRANQHAGVWWEDPHFEATNITIMRMALRADDVLDPELPSFALGTKRLDPRHAWYRETWATLCGPRCWELDALSPVVLRERVEAAIVARLDHAAWTR